jgi:hypothetical protein
MAELSFGVSFVVYSLVGKDGFAKRATRNEMWRHGGVLMAGLLPVMVIPRVGNPLLSCVSCLTVDLLGVLSFWKLVANAVQTVNAAFVNAAESFIHLRLKKHCLIHLR